MTTTLFQGMSRLYGALARVGVRPARHMAVALVLLQIVYLAGCTTKKQAKQEASKAFAAGKAQALNGMQKQEPVVTVVGQVRNHTVPWQEGLTLAQAIDAAVYTGFSNPRLIRLTRGEESIEIAVRDLLRGANNPAVEAGDVVEIMR